MQSKIYSINQTIRDIKHHQERVSWLKGKDPRWACGTKVSKSNRLKLLKQSLFILKYPHYGYCSGRSD